MGKMLLDPGSSRGGRLAYWKLGNAKSDTGTKIQQFHAIYAAIRP